MLPRPRPPAAGALRAALALGGCGEDRDPGSTETVPEVGACRDLDADDVAASSNDTEPVACTQAHTAETFAAGDLPDEFAETEYDDSALGAWAYDTCSEAFRVHLGADESVVMRTVLSWAWFRPTESEWDDGARWYRCDLIGGGEQSPSYVDLPAGTEGLLAGIPEDDWMACADGPTVAGSPKVPCTEDHVWRAVTTIKLGEPGDDYPGDRVSEVQTRDFCADSVAAWLGYPESYDYGYTFFHEAEWSTGNRRSVCWARTSH